MLRNRPDLQAIVAYWQKALRLLDWRIQAEYVPDLKASDGGLCYGLCYPFVDNKTARIQVRDPRTPIDAGRDPAVEETVIHELLHLWWAPVGFRTPAEVSHEENAVWAISEALVAHKGSGQELRLARAMMDALGPKSTSGGRGSRREQAMDLATLLAALEAAVESGDMKQVEALIAKIKEASGGGGGEGEPPPPEQGRPQAEPDKEKPTDDKDRGQRTPAQRPRPQQNAASSGSDDVRAQLAELDGFKRDMLLDQRGGVLPEAQRKWAATQPYAVVKGLIDATPAAPPEQRAARGSTPTRGAGTRGTTAGDHNTNEVDRRMGVARNETPAVMIDPNTNKLFISALKPVTVGVAGEVK